MNQINQLQGHSQHNKLRFEAIKNIKTRQKDKCTRLCT